MMRSCSQPQTMLQLLAPCSCLCHLGSHCTTIAQEMSRHQDYIPKPLRCPNLLTFSNH